MVDGDRITQCIRADLIKFDTDSNYKCVGLGMAEEADRALERHTGLYDGYRSRSCEVWDKHQGRRESGTLNKNNKNNNGYDKFIGELRFGILNRQTYTSYANRV